MDQALGDGRARHGRARHSRARRSRGRPQPAGRPKRLPSPARVLGAPVLVLSILVVSTSALTGGSPAGASSTISVGPITDVSAACPNQNEEAEQAVGPSGSKEVYEVWSGCQGIGYARSTDGGASFSPAVTLPGSTGSPGDPDVAVGPDGTVYVSFMMIQGGQSFPIVDASFDHGATFPQVTPLTAPDPLNWGDSPNIAAGPPGVVYVTWDYGPNSSSVVTHCSPVGSCSYSKGDLNVVVQASTDSAKTFGPMVRISPGYPWSGADNAPIAVDAAGHVDVVFQDYPTNPKTHVLSPAVTYFTTSDDGGATWSPPVIVGSGAVTMSVAEWWNEPSIGIDAGGNLYAAWDTQAKPGNGSHTDTGWLSYSQDHGVTWSPPLQGPADVSNVPHIMEVTGGASGQAYVAWLSDSSPHGYALYLRPFSIAGGWLAAPLRVSKLYGNRTVWPGDTFGLSTVDANHIMTSWGSATVPGSIVSGVYAAAVTIR